MADDGAVVFIGEIRTPWKTGAEAPRNMVWARVRAPEVTIEIGAAYRPGLKGLQNFTLVIVIYWMHEARHNLILQNPRHVDGSRGVSALPTPVGWSPSALATVRPMGIDQQAGRITIDAIDCLDGTPLLDIKPWLETIDEVSAQQ